MAVAIDSTVVEAVVDVKAILPAEPKAIDRVLVLLDEKLPALRAKPLRSMVP